MDATSPALDGPDAGVDHDRYAKALSLALASLVGGVLVIGGVMLANHPAAVLAPRRP